MRTALTTEMWEALNGAWLELESFDNDMSQEGFSRFLDWVKRVVLTVDGSAYRTMLRNHAFWFTRLGNAIERADNTARILDVKYHLLLPETEGVGGSLDYFQWTTILREVSALTFLSLGLPAERETLARRRSSHPQPADAALACHCYEILVRHLA